MHGSLLFQGQRHTVPHENTIVPFIQVGQDSRFTSRMRNPMRHNASVMPHKILFARQTGESYSMQEKTVIRSTNTNKLARSVLLRLFSIDEAGHKSLIVTSSPVQRDAASGIRQFMEQSFTIMPDRKALKAVFQVSGRTAWAGATATHARDAAMQACVQDGIETARGALIIINLSLDSCIVESLKTTLNIVRQKAPLATARAVAVGIDEALHDEVRVNVLMLGLGQTYSSMQSE